MGLLVKLLPMIHAGLVVKCFFLDKWVRGQSKVALKKKGALFGHSSHVFNRKNTNPLQCRVSTHTSTPEAEFSSAIVSARLGPQENIDRDRKIRTEGNVDGGGGTELFASQDESHEEDVGEQATAEDEEEQDSGEWAAEEEHEEDEELFLEQF